MNGAGCKEFTAAYQESVAQVVRFWTPEMQTEIASHNIAWAPGKFDFHAYLRASVQRYHRAYSALAGRSGPVCDVGGFWGVFPLTLRRLGYSVTMTEAMEYYGRSFDPLFEYLAQQDVTISDYDPFTAADGLPGKFDAIFIMAVLEHYPHSLERFMRNVQSGLSEGGLLYVEVPNIAYWPKRIQLLRGRTPCVTIGDIYHSRVPFTGHHHEFTMQELRELARMAGLRVTREEYYNYSGSGIRALLSTPVTALAGRFSPSSREVLAVACTQRCAGGTTIRA
ncbi:MAG TPA: class I SAM-dependent methyltransferase [Chthonomonadales bacterium]|nr:class I SAM-dependent methyltransferase [Chthonomonadales bacterium]